MTPTPLRMVTLGAVVTEMPNCVPEIVPVLPVASTITPNPDTEMPAPAEPEMLFALLMTLVPAAILIPAPRPEIVPVLAVRLIVFTSTPILPAVNPVTCPVLLRTSVPLDAKPAEPPVIAKVLLTVVLPPPPLMPAPPSAPPWTVPELLNVPPLSALNPKVPPEPVAAAWRLWVLLTSSPEPYPVMPS